MKKLASLTLGTLFAFQALAIDQTIKINARAPYMSESEFRSEMQGIQDMREMFKKDQAERMRYYTSSIAAKDLTAVVGILGNGGLFQAVNFVFSLGGSAMGTLQTVAKDNLEDAAEVFYQQATNHALYILHTRDERRFHEYLKIPDDVERVKTIYYEIVAMDAFAEFKTDDPAVRGALNARAIIKLIEITKKLSLQVTINTADIAKLKSDSESFKKLLAEKGEEVEKLVSTDLKKDEALADMSKNAKEINETVVKAGRSPAGSVQEQDKVAQKIESSAKEMVAKAADYLRYAEKSLAIMQNLGLSDQDALRAKKYLEYLSTAVSIGKIYAAGGAASPDDYLNAANGLSSIFSGRRPVDAATARHGQIMQALGQILENQQKILEGIKNIYDLQKNTYEALINMYEYNIRSFSKVDDKLDTILISQTAGLISIKDYSEINRQISTCEDFFTSRYYCSAKNNSKKCFSQIIQTPSTNEIYRNFIPDANTLSSVMVTGRFQDYTFQKRHAEAKFDEFIDCKKAVEYMFGPGKPTALFATQSFVYEPTNQSNIEVFLKDGYTALFKLIRPVLLENDLSATSFFFANNIPSNDFRVSSFKISNSLGYYKKNAPRTLSSKDVQAALSLHLSTNALERYVTYLMELSQYDELLDSSRTKLITKQELIELSNSEITRTLEDRLMRAVELINIAISQQTFQAGDGILDYFQTKYLQESDKSSGRDKFIKILHANPYIARNFLYHLMTSRTRSYVTADGKLPRKNLTSFLSDNEEMKRIFADVGVVENGQMTLQGKDSTYSYKIPSAKEISEGKFLHTPELFRLMDLRTKLYEKILNFKDAKERVIDQNEFVTPMN